MTVLAITIKRRNTQCGYIKMKVTPAQEASNLIIYNTTRDEIRGIDDIKRVIIRGGKGVCNGVVISTVRGAVESLLLSFEDKTLSIPLDESFKPRFNTNTTNCFELFVNRIFNFGDT